MALVANTVATAKALYDLRSKFATATTTIVAICSEASVISTSLSRIQVVLLSTSESTRLFQSIPELTDVLDISLTGCAVILSCLDEEIQQMRASPRSTDFPFKTKTKFMWNQDRLRDLLESLRGQQVAINLLIQLLQMDSLEQIKQLMTQSKPTIAKSLERTESLRESHSQLHIPASIFNLKDGEGSIVSYQPSVDAPSEIEFAFDTVLINTNTYRRAFTSAVSKQKASSPQVTEMEVADLPNAAAIESNADQVVLIKGAVRHSEDLAPLTLPGINDTSPGLPLKDDRPEADVIQNLTQQLDEAREVIKAKEQREQEVSREWQEKLADLTSDQGNVIKYVRGLEKLMNKMKQELQQKYTAHEELGRKYEEALKTHEQEKLDVSRQWEEKLTALTNKHDKAVEDVRLLEMEINSMDQTLVRKNIATRELERKYEEALKTHEQEKLDMSREWEEKLTALTNEYQGVVKYARGLEKVLGKMKKELQKKDATNQTLAKTIGAVREALEEPEEEVTQEPEEKPEMT